MFQQVNTTARQNPISSVNFRFLQSKLTLLGRLSHWLWLDKHAKRELPLLYLWFHFRGISALCVTGFRHQFIALLYSWRSRQFLCQVHRNKGVKMRHGLILIAAVIAATGKVQYFTLLTLILALKGNVKLCRTSTMN